MSKLNILVVDDYLDNRLLLSQIITIMKHDCQSAENGKMACDMVCEHYFDIIFMDIEMPVMNGIEATREIRKMPPSRREIPIIAITAHHPNDFSTSFKDIGFTDYISKPYTLNKLSTLITKYCSTK